MLLPRRRKRDIYLPLIQLLVDVLSVTIFLRFCFWFRFSSKIFSSTLSQVDYTTYYEAFNFVVVLVIIFLRYYGLYRSGKQFTFYQEVTRVWKAVITCFIVLTAITFFVRHFSFSRTFLIIAGLTLGLWIASIRFLMGLSVMWIDRWRNSYRNVLIIGCNDSARKLARYFKKNPRLSTRVIGFLDDTRVKGSDFEGIPVLGQTKDLKSYLRIQHQVHEAILVLPDLPQDEVLKIISECEKVLVDFQWAPDILGLIASKMKVDHTAGIPLLSFTDSPLSEIENRVLKRIMDLSFSVIGLVILSPLFLVLAMLVKSTSKGPVFYRQERVGEDGRRFLLYKFRTMQAEAELKTGPVWAKENDPRRTSIGGFLRRNNLDELPQLWNVLMGDMSLVGPRPERLHFVHQFKADIPRYMARHSIKSGITGWAQVNGLRGNTSIEERTKYDLYYIEHWSILFDLKILLLTIFARKNAY